MFIDQDQVKQKKQEEQTKVKEQVQKELNNSKVTSEVNENKVEKQKEIKNSNEVTEVKEAKQTNSSDNWQYQIDEDKMRGTKKIYARVESTNTLQLGFPYNDSKMNITIRKKDNETDVLVSVRGQIVCNEYSERCYLDIKADDNKIVKYDFNEAAHGNSDTVFIKKEKDFISVLKKSKKLIVEVPLYDRGRVQYEFDVSGLKWEE